MKHSKKDITGFYDGFVDIQQSVGINERHFSILNQAKKHGFKRNHRILEIGCGIGTFTRLLSKYIKQKGSVTAVDISPKSIEKARNRFQGRSNVQFETLDLTEHCPFDEKFDSIFLPDVIEHIPTEKHPQLFQNLDTLLAANGALYIHIPNPHYLQWCIQNKPEILQVIDQPIYTHLLSASLQDTNLYIHTLKTYPIWIKDGDYRFIVLKRKADHDFEVKRKQPIRWAVYLKIRKILGLHV